MSSGQKPRWPQFFPRMKQRGRARRRPARITLYDSEFNPVWPPLIGGYDIRKGHIVCTDSHGSRRFTGLWWETIE